MNATVTLDDLCRPWLPGEAPWLDQLDAAHGDLLPIQQKWRDDGFVIIEAARVDGVTLFDDQCEAYARAWLADNSGRLTGWPCDTPYMHEPEVMSLCNRVASILKVLLIGEPMGVHLNLTGWRSTTRDWHQDGYLNPDTTADHYAAVWFALDDIHPDAGPFQYVPGSHREFGVIRQDLMLRALGTDVTNTSWQRESEAILTPLFEQAIDERGLEVREFHAKRGDVLIWHPRLLHRGSVPKNPELERRALIAHYSGIHHRPDMPPAQQHGGGWYFPLRQDHSRCGA